MHRDIAGSIQFQAKQIAKHEIGHVLGLGHANFNGNLMAVNVNH
jgi:predicted Zn-dependent protease